MPSSCILFMFSSTSELLACIVCTLFATSLIELRSPMSMPTYAHVGSLRCVHVCVKPNSLTPISNMFNTIFRRITFQNQEAGPSGAVPYPNTWTGAFKSGFTVFGTSFTNSSSHVLVEDCVAKDMRLTANLVGTTDYLTDLSCSGFSNTNFATGTSNFAGRRVSNLFLRCIADTIESTVGSVGGFNNRASSGVLLLDQPLIKDCIVKGVKLNAGRRFNARDGACAGIELLIANNCVIDTCTINDIHAANANAYGINIFNSAPRTILQDNKITYCDTAGIFIESGANSTSHALTTNYAAFNGPTRVTNYLNCPAKPYTVLHTVSLTNDLTNSLGVNLDNVDVRQD